MLTNNVVMIEYFSNLFYLVTKQLFTTLDN